jgi:hypothetical protein
MILNEFKKMFDTSRNVLRKITTELPEQPLLSPRTEQLISLPTEKPLLPKEVPLLQQKTEEELLPKPSQRESLPLKGLSEKIKTLEEGQQFVPSAPLEEEKPILLEPEEIQEGKLIPQTETGSGIPVGGGTQRRRRMSEIRKRLLRKRRAKAISKSSRLVGRTIGRKPKRKRKFGRRKVIKQIRRRPTTRRRTTTRRRRTIRRRTRR